MREPFAALPLVDAEPLQALVQVGGESRRRAGVVLADEHPDAPGLAVASDTEGRDGCSPCGRTELGRDTCDVAAAAPAEKGKRDVQLLARDHAYAAHACKRLGLPRRQRVNHGGREPQGAEDPELLTGFDASSAAHAASSRLCDRTRRARCNDATAARARTVCRSAGTLNSPACSASGIETWK